MLGISACEETLAEAITRRKIATMVAKSDVRGCRPTKNAEDPKQTKSR